MADVGFYLLQSSPPWSGGKGGDQDVGVTKGGANTKIHALVDGLCLPVKFVVTSGIVADCTKAIDMIQDVEMKCFFADKAYDTNTIIDHCTERKIEPVIPPKSNRKNHRNFDKNLYKARHIVENFFQKLKKFKGIALRSCKTAKAFLGGIYLASIMLIING